MWGMGVTSEMLLIRSPPACSARTAESRPGPGPLTNTSTLFSPWFSITVDVTFSAAVWAAYAVLLRAPRNPDPPAVAQPNVRPCLSVIVMIVLLYEA